MPASVAAPESVNAFPSEQTILFKHYFDGEVVFDRLKPYYNGNQYRFEVPVDEFESLRRFLLEHGFEVTIVDRPTEYYVAVRQYTAHPENIFKQSVHQMQVEEYNCFLMKDEDAVSSALTQGAIRFSDLSLILPSRTLYDFAAMSA